MICYALTICPVVDIMSTYNLYFFSLETNEAITRPNPIPIKIDATKNKAEVLRNINPTPIPISVVPPMIHELLSIFLSILRLLFYLLPT